jgi:hypothetical protein
MRQKHRLPPIKGWLHGLGFLMALLLFLPVLLPFGLYVLATNGPKQLLGILTYAWQICLHGREWG